MIEATWASNRCEAKVSWLMEGHNDNPSPVLTGYEPDLSWALNAYRAEVSLVMEGFNMSREEMSYWRR